METVFKHLHELLLGVSILVTRNNLEQFCSPGDIFQLIEKFMLVTTPVAVRHIGTRWLEARDNTTQLTVLRTTDN